MPNPAAVLPHRGPSISHTTEQIIGVVPTPTQPVPPVTITQVPLPLLVPNGTTDDSSAVSTVNDVSTLGSASATQQRMNFDTLSNMVHIKGAVYNVLFRSIKFISCKSDLMYSTEKNSIAQIILTTINVTACNTLQATCWDQIRHRVPAFLNRKRTTTTNALKTRFEGKHGNDNTYDAKYYSNNLIRHRLHYNIWCI